MASDPSKDEIYRKYLDSRMAQQIRESSQELRALEMQIRTAYVNKALRAQLAEKEKARLEQQLRQQNECEQFRQMLLAEEERVRQQKAAAKGEQMKLRGVLQEQMIEKHQARKLLYEEFLNEKLIIDEIMRRLRTEQIECVLTFSMHSNYYVMMARDGVFCHLQGITTKAIRDEVPTGGYGAIET